MKNNRAQLKKIEDLGALLEEYLILDNRYTEHRYFLLYLFYLFLLFCEFFDRFFYYFLMYLLTGVWINV